MNRVILFSLLLMISMNLHAQKEQASNRHFWHTDTTSAPAESIWAIWTDVPNWKAWDSGLKDASLMGAFVLHAKGEILSLEGRKSSFEIVEYEAGKTYTMKTRLPLGRLYVKRFLTEENGTTQFTHEVWFAGLSRGLFASAFGKKFRAMLPDVLDNIKTIAEQ
ncbi:MAG: SRPBCC family protein [Bacteroidota bacterium]